MHYATQQKITHLYPNVFEHSGNKRAYQTSGIGSHGVRGLIYEVAQSAAYGTVRQVEKINIYEFYNYLSYVRSQGKYQKKAIESGRGS